MAWISRTVISRESWSNGACCLSPVSKSARWSAKDGNRACLILACLHDPCSYAIATTQKTSANEMQYNEPVQSKTPFHDETLSFTSCGGGGGEPYILFPLDEADMQITASMITSMTTAKTTYLLDDDGLLEVCDASELCLQDVQPFSNML